MKVKAIPISSYSDLRNLIDSRHRTQYHNTKDIATVAGLVCGHLGLHQPNHDVSMLKLPCEILDIIFGYCSWISRLQLRSTCRSLRTKLFTVFNHVCLPASIENIACLKDSVSNLQKLRQTLENNPLLAQQLRSLVFQDHCLSQPKPTWDHPDTDAFTVNARLFDSTLSGVLKLALNLESFQLKVWGYEGNGHFPDYPLELHESLHTLRRLTNLRHIVLTGFHALERLPHGMPEDVSSASNPSRLETAVISCKGDLAKVYRVLLDNTPALQSLHIHDRALNWIPEAHSTVSPTTEHWQNLEHLTISCESFNTFSEHRRIISNSAKNWPSLNSLSLQASVTSLELKRIPHVLKQFNQEQLRRLCIVAHQEDCFRITAGQFKEILESVKGVENFVIGEWASSGEYTPLPGNLAEWVEVFRIPPKLRAITLPIQVAIDEATLPNAEKIGELIIEGCEDVVRSIYKITDHTIAALQTFAQKFFDAFDEGGPEEIRFLHPTKDTRSKPCQIICFKAHRRIAHLSSLSVKQENDALFWIPELLSVEIAS
ncbi:hypothetical protein ABKN59_004411 [Abortiporus biennis]